MPISRVSPAPAPAAPILTLLLAAGCGEVPPGPPEGAGPGGQAVVGRAAPDDGDRPLVPGSPAPLPDPPDDRDLVDMTAAELVERARMVYSLDERIRILEAAVAKEPGDRKALLMLMQATEQRGGGLAKQEGRREDSKPDLYRAAEVARALLGQGQPLDAKQRAFAAMVFYNEACNLALDGKPDLAIESLREAFALGFKSPYIHEDEELATLRDRDDFRELAGRIPRRGGGAEGPAADTPPPNED